MEGFTGTQYYPDKKKTFMQRIQCIINAYYEDDAPISVGSDTAEDDVLRLGNNLSSFPKCVNEYVDKGLVEELSSVLPQDDIDELNEKHEKKCKESLEAAKKAIKAIETYAAMTETPHLFTKEETDDMSDANVLELIVRGIADMYGEEQVGAENYIEKLIASRQRLDTTLLSLDYGD